MTTIGPKFSLRAALVAVAFIALALAIWAARPSATIRVSVHSDGTLRCESVACDAAEFEDEIKHEVARRRRWLVNPTAQVHVDPGVKFARVPKVLQLLASAGCKDVDLGLPPELSSRLSHPELASER